MSRNRQRVLPVCRLPSERAVRQCVRACLGYACGGLAGSTNSRRNARVYHAATNDDDSVRGRFRRRPNAGAAARSSNPATQQKPLCVVVRSNARSIARSPLIAHFAAAGAACAYDDRGDTTINVMIKNAVALVAIACETHSSLFLRPDGGTSSDENNIIKIARARFAVQQHSNNNIIPQIVLIL